MNDAAPRSRRDSRTTLALVLAAGIPDITAPTQYRLKARAEKVDSAGSYDDERSLHASMGIYICSCRLYDALTAQSDEGELAGTPILRVSGKYNVERNNTGGDAWQQYLIVGRPT